MNSGLYDCDNLQISNRFLVEKWFRLLSPSEILCGVLAESKGAQRAEHDRTALSLFVIDKKDTLSFNRHNYCILKQPRAINAVIYASLFAE